MNFLWQTAKNVGLIFTCISFLISVNAYGDYHDTMERSFDVNPGGQLTLESDIGSVEIKTNNNGKVDIAVEIEIDTDSEKKIQKELDRLDIAFEQDGDDVFIMGIYESKEWGFFGSSKNRLRLKYNISVPENYDVDIVTGGGGISVDGLHGKVVTETSGGGLTFENIEGDIHGRTSGGGITIENCAGNTDVKTSGGGIIIDKAEGEVYARTSGGGIEIDEVRGIIDASTSGGGITAYISGQPENDCRLTTSGGGIKVYLDDNVNLDVDASTSAGRVKTDFAVKFSGRMNKSRLRGEINDGGPELYLRTSAGNIYIEKI